MAVKLKSRTITGGAMIGPMPCDSYSGDQPTEMRSDGPTCSSAFRKNIIESVKRRFFAGLVIFPFSMYMSPSRETPVTIKLAVGTHKLELTNAELGTDTVQTITISENQTTTIDKTR